MKILVSSGAWNGALCCVESLGRQGHEVDVLVSGRMVPAGWSRYRSRRIEVPREADEEAYFNALKPILEKGGYDLFIPVSDGAMAIVNRYRTEVDALVRTVLPPNEAIITAGDKARTMKMAASADVDIPPTEFPATLEEFPAAMARLGERVVVKIPRSSAGKGVLITDDHDRAMRYVKAHADSDNWPILQAFQEGDGCGIATVCRHGEIVAAHGFRVRPEHVSNGTAPYSEELADPRAFDQAATLARAIGWHGPLDFDFIGTPDGRYALLELNPRFSGTVSFGSAVGFDLPGALIDIARDEPVRAMPARVAGRRYRSGLEFELGYLAKKPVSRAGEVVSGWFSRGIHYTNRLGDPGVLATQIASSAINAVRKSIGSKEK